jgi:hypothetical protein
MWVIIITSRYENESAIEAKVKIAEVCASDRAARWQNHRDGRQKEEEE